MTSLVFPMTQQRRKLTPEEILESQALKELYEAIKKTKKEVGESFSQDDLADAAGWTQGNVSAYLTGRIPLNLDAAITFSNLLRQPVSSFSPRLAEKIKMANVESVNNALISKPLKMNRVPVLSAQQIAALYGNNANTIKGEPMPTAERAHWTSREVSAQSLVATLIDNSMSPEYHSGDEFLIEPTLTVSPTNIVLAVDKKGNNLIRRIRIIEVGVDGSPAVFELYAANPDFPVLRSNIHDLILVGPAIELVRKLI